MRTELIINTVDGWSPVTRLYRVDLDYWLISSVDVFAVHDAITELVPDLNLPRPKRQTGHVEIYRADVTTRTILNRTLCDGGDPENPDDYTVLVPGETHYIIDAVDADGDPLNGLTPEWVLPHGTTFEQAIDHIIEETTA